MSRPQKFYSATAQHLQECIDLDHAALLRHLTSDALDHIATIFFNEVLRRLRDSAFDLNEIPFGRDIK